MKVIRNIFILFLLAIAIIVSMKVNEGYQMFHKAISEVSIEDKVSEIQSKDNYTKIEELPEMYIKAVVAAEDHRFYQSFLIAQFHYISPYEPP